MTKVTNWPMLVERNGKQYVFSKKECEKAQLRAQVASDVSKSILAGSTVSRAIYDAAHELDMSPQTAWTYWRTFSAVTAAKS